MKVLYVFEGLGNVRFISGTFGSYHRVRVYEFGEEIVPVNTKVGDDIKVQRYNEILLRLTFARTSPVRYPFLLF